MRSLLVPAAAIVLLVMAAPKAGAQSSATMSSALPRPANHQIFPAGPAKERGLRELNNSGQVGTATLHADGAGSTEVVLDLKSVPAGKTELAALVRYPAGDCDTFPHGQVTYALSPVTGGSSSTKVPISADRLLSGNYIVVVYSTEKSDHYFSCGHLFQ
jgi:hypothetical protein